VVILGAILAVVAGTGYNASAAVQKREAVSVGTGVAVVRLLPALARRRVWLIASLLELLAWLAQAVALAVAPIALVIPLMGLGGALLVFLGIRWLGERFSPAEIWAIVLVAAGATAAAVAAEHGRVVRAPLPFTDQVVIAAVAVGTGLAIAAFRTGIAYGTAAGFLYAATAIYTKEIGDRFAVHGVSAVGLLLASPTPWLIAAVAITALALVQAGFQRANAASVVAAMTAVDTIGPILAGFFLYHERFPAGASGVALALGVAAAVTGTALLTTRLHEWPNQPAKKPV
jgi:drug/metabolite transporter (DMT)-like permease